MSMLCSNATVYLRSEWRNKFFPNLLRNPETADDGWNLRIHCHSHDHDIRWSHWKVKSSSTKLQSEFIGQRARTGTCDEKIDFKLMSTFFECLPVNRSLCTKLQANTCECNFYVMLSEDVPNVMLIFEWSSESTFILLKRDTTSAQWVGWIVSFLRFTRMHDESSLSLSPSSCQVRWLNQLRDNNLCMFYLFACNYSFFFFLFIIRLSLCLFLLCRVHLILIHADWQRRDKWRWK